MRLLIISLFSLVFWLSWTPVLHAKAKTKRVTLERLTYVEVEILPDLGSHFVFPFVLDEGSSEIPFTLTSTNKLFKVIRAPKRNSFVVLIDQDYIPETLRQGELPRYRGNIFLVVGDSIITLDLRVTNVEDDHVNEYIFELGNLDKEILLQNVLNRRIQELEADYQKKLEEIDRLAEDKVIYKLAELAIRSPKVKAIKEKVKLTTADGEIILIVDRALKYGDFVAYIYEIENKTDKSLRVTGIELLRAEETNNPEQVIPSVKELPPHLMAEQVFEGVLAVEASQLDPDKVLTFRIVTNKGDVSATW